MTATKKGLLVSVMLALLAFGLAFGAVSASAAEVGYIQQGETADTFKLYDIGENLFDTELGHQIITYNRRGSYNDGYRLDNGGQFYPLTDYTYHLAEWKWLQVGNTMHYYVYINDFNPDFPEDVDPDQQEGEMWHNNVYLYAGDLAPGRYLLRSTYVRPFGGDTGVLIPDDDYAFALTAAVFKRDPESGEIDYGRVTYYTYPSASVFDVEEGDYVVLYYSFYAWKFEWYHSTLATSMYFSYAPHLYRLTEYTPEDLANTGKTFDDLIAQLKWESYEDGHGDGYLVGYDEGFLNGLDEGYKQGYADGEEKGYSSGYAVGSKDGYFSGHQQGQVVGYEKGFKEGYDEGENDGYAAGTEEGWPLGYEAGHTDGYNTGHADGYTIGNDEGYRRGVKELDTAGGVIGGFLSSGWDICVKAVRIINDGTTFNGLSIGGIIFTAIGIAVLGFIIKKLKG